MAYSYYDNFNGKSRPTNSKTYNGPRSRQRSTRGKGGGSNHKRAAPSNTSPTSVADRNIGDWREPGRPVEGSSNPPTSQPETEATRQGPIGRKRTLESTNDQYGPRRGAQHPGPPLLPAMLGTVSLIDLWVVTSSYVVFELSGDPCNLGMGGDITKMSYYLTSDQGVY